MDHPEPRGRCFEELEPGQQFTSATRAVLQADVEAFAALSGDANPIHTDEAFAARTVFRGRIAHGLLIEALASGLAWGTGIFRGTIVALHSIEIAFEKPVRAGDEIHVVLSVLEREAEPGARRGWVRLRTQVLNQRGETVLDGAWKTVMLRREPSR